MQRKEFYLYLCLLMILYQLKTIISAPPLFKKNLLFVMVLFSIIFTLQKKQMDLGIKDKYFVVIGAGSGLGRAIAESLLAEGAYVIANARSEEKLISLKKISPIHLRYIVGDITSPDTQKNILKVIDNIPLAGAVINAGGPPAMSAMETKLTDWDSAYQLVLRWKIQFVQKLIPKFIDGNYGRLVFIESISVKQPVENLVLSTAFRMAMVGYVKTLSQEIGKHGITLNVLAPAYHDTHALKRVIAKKSEVYKMSIQEAKKEMEAETLTNKLGQAKDFASLAIWLLSENSRYITGQTISVDGGISKGVFG